MFPPVSCGYLYLFCALTAARRFSADATKLRARNCQRCPYLTERETQGFPSNINGFIVPYFPMNVKRGHAICSAPYNWFGNERLVGQGVHPCPHPNLYMHCQISLLKVLGILKPAEQSEENFKKGLSRRRPLPCAPFHPMAEVVWMRRARDRTKVREQMEAAAAR